MGTINYYTTLPIIFVKTVDYMLEFSHPLTARASGYTHY